jgi:hypothetical protein
MILFEHISFVHRNYANDLAQGYGMTCMPKILVISCERKIS